MQRLHVIVFILITAGYFVECQQNTNTKNNDANSQKNQNQDSSSSTQKISSSSSTGDPLPVTASLSLKDMIHILMAKHGSPKVGLAFHSLDSKPLGEIMRILLVEVDKDLAQDIVAMQNHAQNNDKQLVALIAKIVSGDGKVAQDIFMWDEKLRKFPWWARIRQRMFINLDKYVKDFQLTAEAILKGLTSTN